MNTVYLDAGHGAIDPATGKYTTKESGGGKFFVHPRHRFHLADMFCEGVFNRQLAKRIAEILRAKGVRVVECYHAWRDTSLKARVDIANGYEALHNDNGIFVSIHANAANTKARGFSVWTTKGNTNSDGVSTNIINAVQRSAMAIGKVISVRTDLSDGDKDYEASFQVLRDSNMRAVLVETLFFDNLEDAILLHDQSIQQQFAVSIAQGIIDSFVPKDTTT